VIERQVIRKQALEVAAGWSGPDAPASWALTARLLRTIADDSELVDLAMHIPLERLPALLLSAAICYLLDSFPDAPLAAYFPRPSGPQSALDAAFGSALHDFCLNHAEALLELCRAHRYQMNEVGRCAQLVLALGLVAAHQAGRPLALVDVGTGAGFGLQLDRYRYAIEGLPPFGDPASPVKIGSALRGALLPPLPPAWPPIVGRTGIDLAPVNLHDAEPWRWLRACIPPDPASLGRFDAAVEVALRSPARLVAGDALTELPRVLREAPPEALTVVLDAYTAVFFDDQRLRQLRALLYGEGTRRDLVWISLDPLVPLGSEARFSVQDLEVPDELIGEYRAEGVFGVLGVVDYRGGERRARLLARAHPSGTWLEWLDGEPAVSS